jgi:K+-transporting ATPase ATPase C chain
VKKIFVSSLIMVSIMTFMLGIVYPVVIWGAGRIFFARQAGGSLVYEGGKIIGSSLIAQEFTQAKYFHPRPSAAGNGYDATSSGGSNLAPTNLALIKNMKAGVDSLQKENSAPIPIEMVTQSGSGLDPHISVASALWQAPRVAKARGIDEKQLGESIKKNTEDPFLGFIGEQRVNVLSLNMDLDRNMQAAPSGK